MGRHVSTPKLGRSSRVTSFLQYRSRLERQFVEIPFDKSHAPNSISAGRTVVEGHNRSEKPTSGPYLHHVSMLGPFLTVHGVSKSMNSTFSTTTHDWCPTKNAVNSPRERSDYRLSPKLSTLPRAVRFQYPKMELRTGGECDVGKISKSHANHRKKLMHDNQIVLISPCDSRNISICEGDDKQNAVVGGNLLESNAESPMGFHELKVSKQTNGLSKDKHSCSGDIDIINISSLKRQHQFVLSPQKNYKENKQHEKIGGAMIRASFDTSTYSRTKKPNPTDLSPVAINKLSRVNVFKKSFALRCQHKSSPLKATNY